VGRCKFKLTFVSQVARAPMPHTVSFVQDSDDPNVKHPFLINLGPLGTKKEEEPDTNRLPLKDRSWPITSPRPSSMTMVELLERSSATYKRDTLEMRLVQRKYNMLDTLACNLDDTQISSALERTKGGYNAKIFAPFANCTFDQKRVAQKFPSACFKDLARKALVKTTDFFREVVCIKHDKDYKCRIHVCNGCQDHFDGASVEIDHVDVGFHVMLLAFLDSHVKDWCILPNHRTLDKYNGPNNHGYRGKIQSAHKLDDVETLEAYWQRVKNECKLRWVRDGLADKFVAFHNRVAKLQVLCFTCHDTKTNADSSFYTTNSIRKVTPVYDETIGKSKKRRLNESKADAIVKKEDALLEKDSINSIVNGLRKAIHSREHEMISDALAKVPSELYHVLPMVKTATLLLDNTSTDKKTIIDIINCLHDAIESTERDRIADALANVPLELQPVLPIVKTAATMLADIDAYNSAGVNLNLTPLPTDPFGCRKRRVTWDAS